MITIRKERPTDAKKIHRLHETAFEQSTEADIVDRLRRVCPEILSLVAEERSDIVGHILFSPVTVDNRGQKISGMGLAPMAVLPERQRLGIGSALVRHGLDILTEQETPFVVVLGHPEYYPRFGFEKASVHGLMSQWKGVPDAAFMVVVLDNEKMADVSGRVRFHEAFDAAL
jgi:putative acetyltransferase